MKIADYLLTVIAAASLLLGGCSKSGGGGGSVDASPIEKSFASAEATVKSAADKAVAAVKNADYSGATAELQKLASNVKLTDEQKRAVSDVLAKVQKALADAGSKATEDAKKALGDAQKALGK